MRQEVRARSRPQVWWETNADLGEAVARDHDLEIFVLPCRLAEEQVDRPAGGHGPRHVDGVERLRDLARRERAPGSIVGLHAADDSPGTLWRRCAATTSPPSGVR
jgi:hypothetical protein